MSLLQPNQLVDAKILIRVPNWVGDAVLCLPALRALRHALPQTELTLLARPWVNDVFPAQELRCRVISYDTRTEHRGVVGRWRMASDLRAENFQAAILLQNALDAAILSMLSGIPIRAGYARQGRGPLLTHPIDVPRPGEIPSHEAHYYLEMLRRLGLIAPYNEVREISLSASTEQRTASRKLLQDLLARKTEEDNIAPESHPVIGISPGASFGTAKRWPAGSFAQLSQQLQQDLGASCIFFGSAEEKPLVDSLLASSGPRSISLAGETSLSDFIRLVQGCDLYLTNDTGTMHVAAALGVPTLALFGPTDEFGTRPLGACASIAIGEAECRPCKLRHCPIDHRCMTSITPQMVFASANALLERATALKIATASQVQ
ncbi:MAG: lipopolysaccharide heptosyltransferase II [Acidobacteria bacterium RIFCSPLOWO2_12_FULL_54_10]|nr:MAG: lipopolysaccharide heptosyltransferase II [Acidobacteria bacterium RIFCSPLOWO2_12_FULL_54_10]